MPLRILLLAIISGQCLVDSASADPPPSLNAAEKPIKIPPLPDTLSAPNPPSRPQLKFSKQDFVPIPDMVEMPIDLPAVPAKPAPATKLPPSTNSAQIPPPLQKRVPTQNIAVTAPTPVAPPTVAQPVILQARQPDPLPPPPPSTAQPYVQVPIPPPPQAQIAVTHRISAQTPPPSVAPSPTRARDASTSAYTSAPANPPAPTHAYTRAANTPATTGTRISVTTGMAKPAPYVPVRVLPVADLTPAETHLRAEAEAEAALEAADAAARAAANPQTPKPITPIKPAPSLVPLVTAQNDDSFPTGPDGQPLVYRSPGIVVRQQELRSATAPDKLTAASADKELAGHDLAELAPAAGVPASDIPLIALPDPNAPPPVMPAPGKPPRGPVTPPVAKVATPTATTIATTTAPVATPTAVAAIPPLDPDAKPATPAIIAAATPTATLPIDPDPDAKPKPPAIAAATPPVAAPPVAAPKPAAVASATLPATKPLPAVTAALPAPAAPATPVAALKPPAPPVIAAKPTLPDPKAKEIAAKKPDPKPTEVAAKKSEPKPDPKAKEIATKDAKKPASKPQEVAAKKPDPKTEKLTKAKDDKKPKEIAKAEKKPAPKAKPESENTPIIAQGEAPRLTVPATAFSATPPTAPPPVMLPGTEIMPSVAASALTPNDSPTPLLAQKSISPADRAVVAAVPSAPGFPSNVPYTAVQRWGNTEGPLPPTPAGASTETQLTENPAPLPMQPQVTQQPLEPPPQPLQTAAGQPTQPFVQVPVPAAPAPLFETPPLPTIVHPASVADSSEPQRQISPESQKILDGLPATITPKKSTAATEQLAVLRSKNTPEEEQQQPTAKPVSVTHDGMGIKIEVKTPHVNVDYELEKGYNALSAGNIDAATQIYKTVLANDANNKNALFGLATIYHRAGQLEKARPLYAHLLAVDPNNRDGLNNFLVLLSDEAPEDALVHLETLRQANPDFSPIPAQMAVIHQKLGQTAQAIENMTRAIELAPENLAYRYNFAIMLDKQKKYEEAAILYRQILQAYQRGDKIPGNIQQIQQRLTFISSNKN